MLLYAPCILRKIKNARKAPEIKKLIESRLDALDRGKYNALIKDIEDEAMEEGLGLARSGELEVELSGRRCNSMVLDGKISEAVKTVTNADKGGLFLPTDIDPKSGLPVMDVLRQKHPPSQCHLRIILTNMTGQRSFLRPCWSTSTRRMLPRKPPGSEVQLGPVA